MHSIRVECHQRTPILRQGQPLTRAVQAPRNQLSRTLLIRRDGGEGRPALLDVVAPTVRTQNPTLFVVDEHQDLRECLLAGVAEEFVMGHSHLPGRERPASIVDRAIPSVAAYPV